MHDNKQKQPTYQNFDLAQISKYTAEYTLAINLGAFATFHLYW